jgi:hypothetical protein
MRSKVLFVCIIICHSALSLFAQNKNDRFHLLGSERGGQVNGYFGPFISLSDVEGHTAIDAGATGGVVFNNKFFIGLYGQKLVTKVPRTDLSTIGYTTFTDGEIDMIHAGGVLGYIHKSRRILNWGLSGSAGMGRIDISAKGPMNKYTDKIYDDVVFILTPKLFVEMKMTMWCKINASAGYRYVGMINGVYESPDGETIPTFIQTDYSKPEFSISLLLGSFGFRSYLLK